MKHLTNQEIFDASAVGMLEQDSRCENCSVEFHGGVHDPATCTGSHGCVYSDQEDRHCAVGFVFKLAGFDPVEAAINSHTLSMILDGLSNKEAYEILMGGIGTGTGDALDRRTLLQSLQLVHDMNRVDDWAKDLEGIAVSFDLDPSKMRAVVATKIPETPEGA